MKKTKVLRAIALLGMSVVLAMGMLGCPHKTEEITSPGPFVEITPPKGAITAPTSGIGGVYSNNEYYTGVFVENRKVKLSTYKLAEKEVTYNQWREVYNWAITQDKDNNGEIDYKFANAGRAGSKGATGTVGSALPEDETYGEHPVTKVSWRDVIVWCNAYTEMTKGADECVYRVSDSDDTVLKDATDEAKVDNAYCNLSKKGYRLPTEAEWGYAARWQKDNSNEAINYGSAYLIRLDRMSGATKPIGYGGVDSAPTTAEGWEALRKEASRVAVYDEYYNGSGWVVQDPATNGTAKVGSREPNASGLYDMSGNVWEWCFDGWSTITAEEGDPVVENPLGGAFGSRRVVRGGSWRSKAFDCGVGRRGIHTPGLEAFSLGFRLAFTP